MKSKWVWLVFGVFILVAVVSVLHSCGSSGSGDTPTPATTHTITLKGASS